MGQNEGKGRREILIVITSLRPKKAYLVLVYDTP